MSKAWCTCGDELYSCGDSAEGQHQYDYSNLNKDIFKGDRTYYCFGCDKYFILNEIITSSNREIVE